jgi:hypothetical protein
MMQHGIFHYGFDNIQNLELFENAREAAPRLSRRPKIGPPRQLPSDDLLKYGKFGKKAAEEALESYGAQFYAHGRGYKPDEEVYEEMRKAVFLEKELFGKRDFEGVGEMTSDEFKSLQSRFNQKFDLFILQGSKFSNLLHHFMERRELPVQNVPFVSGPRKEAAQKWVENVRRAEKDPHKAWDMIRHGRFHYGDALDWNELREQFFHVSDTLDPHYKKFPMKAVRHQTRMRTDMDYRKRQEA